MSMHSDASRKLSATRHVSAIYRVVMRRTIVKTNNNLRQIGVARTRHRWCAEETPPESEALPRVRFCAESKIKNSRQKRLCRERNKQLPAQKKHSAQRLICREPNKKLSAKKKHLAKISLPRANFLALGKEI
jgi:hypothetical protein